MEFGSTPGRHDRHLSKQALREIEYQLRRIGRNVNQIAHNANREMNATIEDEALRLSREQA